jgi:Tfp pilus assembly protein PilF
MDKITIKYAAYAKVAAPQPIRLMDVSWGGAPQNMQDGSEPQPWHCLPFHEGSTYGLELIYPYEKECHVVGSGGALRFDWDFANEPGGALTGGEFVAFAPRDASKYYMFNTRLDLQPPPGYALRSEPHPRYFTDDTGTAPLAMIGHLQGEWYPQLIKIVFRAPGRGQRHIFRKGEPFAQLLFVPRQIQYELTRMSFEESADRRDLEHAIETTQLDLADNIWRNPGGMVFNNHYKVLARAFARDGLAGVKAAVQKAEKQQEKFEPGGKSIAECLAVGAQRMREQRHEQAREIFTSIAEREPQNAAAHSALGVCFSALGNFKYALEAMSRAVALQPGSANYHTNLGELLRRMGRLREAETSFQTALSLTPNDPEILSVLGMTLFQQGRPAEALQAYRAALAGGAQLPQTHLGIGKILAQHGQYREARASFETALAIAPTFSPARQALAELPPDTLA